MKNFSFDGRLGSDAEVKTTKGGKPYVRFSVANNSFNGGNVDTDWIDVTSYDQYVVENRAKYLTKGTYVIINGDVRFDVKVRDQKLWKNIYVTAYSIDTPSFGKSSEEQTTVAHAEETSEPTMAATYTAQPTQVAKTTVTEEAPVYQAKVTETVQSAPAYASSNSMDDDNLPF